MDSVLINHHFPSCNQCLLQRVTDFVQSVRGQQWVQLLASSTVLGHLERFAAGPKIFGSVSQSIADYDGCWARRSSEWRTSVDRNAQCLTLDILPYPWPQAVILQSFRHLGFHCLTETSRFSRRRSVLVRTGHLNAPNGAILVEGPPSYLAAHQATTMTLTDNQS